MLMFLGWYAFCAIIFGFFVGLMTTTQGEWSPGKPIKHPRLVGGALIGLIWPYLIYRMIVLR